VAVAHPAFAQVDRRASLTVKIALDPSVGGNVTTAGTAVNAGSLTAAAASPELSAVTKAGERWSLPVSIVLRF
jgi:hypothetical protein